MKKRIFVLIVFLFVVFSCSAIAAMLNVDNSNPACSDVAGTPFCTIQAAITAANPRDTINVAAGTYDEQVVIEKSLTLQGVGDTTIIQPSSAAKLTQVFDGLFWYGTPNTKQIAGIIVANVPDGSSVIIKNLKVDESSVTTKPAGADYLSGIFYRETGGTIDTVSIVGGGAWSAGDRGYGAYLSAGTNTVSVEVKGSTITNFDKEGINAEGNTLTVNIHHNTITGRGPTLVGDEVQNGVDIGRDATGTVNYNTISNLEYGPKTWWAAGIMFYHYVSPTGKSATAIGNTITNCQIGIMFKNANALAQDNIVSGGTVGLAGIHAQPNYAGAYTASFVGNTISGITDYSAIDAETYATLTPGTGATLTITIRNNQLTGGYGTADGVYVGGGAGSVTATISDNTISGWPEYGINLGDARVAGATITGNTLTNNVQEGVHIDATVNAANVVVNFNNIFGNQNYGAFNGGTGTLNAENNWWGSATGPKHASNPTGTGDIVTDGLTFDPWLTGETENSQTDIVNGAAFTVTNDDAGIDVDVTGATYSDTTGTIGTAGYTGTPTTGTTFQAGTGDTAMKYFDVFTEGFATGQAKITLSYTDAELLASGLAENTLNIYMWYGGAWDIGTDPGRDTGENKVWGTFNAIDLVGAPGGLGGTFVITQAATDITSTDATLNGLNGGTDATGHSFWVSLATFDTSSPTMPAGVYSTADLGTVAANTAFSALLTSVTGLPAVTPSTEYYFAAWSEVGGTWYPGEILSFITSDTTTTTTTSTTTTSTTTTTINLDDIMNKLNEIETKVDTVQATLDDSSFGLKEIKDEIIWVVSKITRILSFFGITDTNDFCEVQDQCGVVQTPKCDDGKDNDGDGACDFTGCDDLPKDFSCSSRLDDDESDPEAMCQDGEDNDGDGYTDFPDDPSCTSTQDNSESTECNDDVDNDNDGKTDFPDDPGCADENDQNEIGQCQDGIDNDGDGTVDLADFSCGNDKTKNDETNPKAQCQDTTDNDGDGYTDLADWGCQSSQDNSETGLTECTDGINNDNDVLIDQKDPGCTDANDNSELGQCQDGIDNDGDTLVDLMDPGCANADDNDESDATSQCQDGIDNDADGAKDFPADFSCDSLADNDETNPKAYCQDGIDGADPEDTDVDYPADWGCDSLQDNSEFNDGTTQCSDGADNDNDGLIDQNDPDCTNKMHDDESTPPTVIFRTNAVAGDYAAGTWIAYDFNGDGAMEGRKATYTLTYTCPATCLIMDDYGKCLVKIMGNYYMSYQTSGSWCVMRQYYSPEPAAITTSTPTAPFTANHQEVLAP